MKLPQQLCIMMLHASDLHRSVAVICFIKFNNTIFIQHKQYIIYRYSSMTTSMWIDMLDSRCSEYIVMYVYNLVLWCNEHIVMYVYNLVLWCSMHIVMYVYNLVLWCSMHIASCMLHGYQICIITYTDTE